MFSLCAGSRSIMHGRAFRHEKHCSDNASAIINWFRLFRNVSVCGTLIPVTRLFFAFRQYRRRLYFRDAHLLFYQARFAFSTRQTWKSISLIRKTFLFIISFYRRKKPGCKNIIPQYTLRGKCYESMFIYYIHLYYYFYALLSRNCNLCNICRLGLGLP